MSKLTIETVQQCENKILELSKYNETILKGLSVNVLRELTTGLIPDNRKYKKVELLELIFDITKNYQSVKEQIIVKEKETQLKTLKTVLDDSINKSDYVELLIKAWKDKEDINELASKFVRLWLLETDSYNTIAKTKLNTVNEAIKAVILLYPQSKNYLGLDNDSSPNKTKSSPNTFYYVLLYNTYPDLPKLQIETLHSVTSEVIESYELDFSISNLIKYGNNLRRQIENKIITIEDKVILDGNKIFDWAKKVISDSVNSSEKEIKSWYKLSLALALTSGRRMEELHGETVHYPTVKRFFKLDDNDSTMIYISQLAKSISNTYFTFKPLVDAKLWLSAYKKLPTTCLNLTENKVNQTVSSNCSKFLKSTFLELGFTQENKNRKGSYKDSRDFYMAYRVYNEYLKGLTNFGDESNFVQSIIGHQDKSSQVSYKKFVIE